MSHIPVLLEETISALSIKDGDRIVDATFGGGGHTKAILDSAKCFVFGIDRDPEAILRAKEIEEKYGDKFRFIPGKFSEISELLKNTEKFNAILFDFGVSSFQIDDPKRGFSFSKDGALDMRMSKDDKISAFDVVNSFSEEDLATIIWTYGDEPKSRRIASEIIRARAEAEIDTTIKLREIISRAFKFSSINKKHSRIDVATKTFQAIRIYVNDELLEIDTALKQLPKILKKNARIVTIAFHSLEDRIVKNWAKSSRNFINPINKEVIKPSYEEVSINPRSRSAVLRAFKYTGEDVVL